MKRLLVTSVLLFSTALAQNEPATIALPNGFEPEGVVAGEGTTLYAGSLANGTIYQADVTTGEGRPMCSTRRRERSCKVTR